MTTQTPVTPSSQTQPAAVATAKQPRDRGAVMRALRDAFQRPAVLLALCWLLLVMLASGLADVLSSHDPLTQDLVSRFATPSADHPLGTDELGRDMLSRLLHGGGQLLGVAVIPVSVAYAIAIPAGLLVGYVGGRADRVADFFVSVLLAVPSLVIVLATAVITSQNLFIMTMVLGVMLSGGIFRLVRATTQACRDLLYVDAARVSGVSRRVILGRHILPNILPPLLVQAFLMYSGAFLFLTSLSFLGVGFDPEKPSWGRLVFDASGSLDSHPWLMVPIGVVLIFTVASLNYLGNSLLETLPSSQRLRLLTPPRRPVLPGQEGDGKTPKTELSTPRASLSPEPIALEVEDLTVAFRTNTGRWQTVVDKVSFTVHRGETLCLVGESGCGKTMTALALLGLLPEGGASSGSVRLQGKEILQLSEKDMAGIRGSQMAMVSQEPMVALDPCFTVRSQLGEVIRAHRGGSRVQVQARIIELLTLVGIPNPEAVQRCFPHQLSGGMAQRVCIALALAGDPSVLVADEPTTALDPTIQAEILDLLRDLQARLGLAIVLVTHDLGVVADIGDTAAVMYAGQVVELAQVDQLLQEPEHPYSRGLLNAVPEKAARGEKLPTVPGVVPAPPDWPSHCRFAARCPLAEEACKAAAIPLLQTSACRASRCIRVEELLARQTDLTESDRPAPLRRTKVSAASRTEANDD